MPPLRSRTWRGRARYPLAALAFSIALLALGGLPPLAGFMSKWQIFVPGFNANGWFIGLMIFMALNSVLSLAYYAPLVNMMYRGNIPAGAERKTRHLAISLPLVLMTAWSSCSASSCADELADSSCRPAFDQCLEY